MKLGLQSLAATLQEEVSKFETRFINKVMQQPKPLYMKEFQILKQVSVNENFVFKALQQPKPLYTKNLQNLEQVSVYETYLQGLAPTKATSHKNF